MNIYKGLIAYLRKMPTSAIIAFLVSMVLCFLLLTVAAYNRYRVERIATELLFLEKSRQINGTILELLARLRIVSFNISQNHCSDTDMLLMLSYLVDDPLILSLKIAPEGRVLLVYPVEGNEALIGLDFFEYNPGYSYQSKNLATMAKETGEIVLGGPFMVAQAGQYMIAKSSVFINSSCGAECFWGIVSMTIYYPQILHSDQSIAYTIWRIYPDSNEVQMLFGSEIYTIIDFKESYIDIPFYIINADWNFRIWAYHTRYTPLEITIALVASILMSILLAAFVKKRHELKKIHSQNLLEKHMMAMKLLVSSLERQDHSSQEEKKRWALFKHDIRHFNSMMLSYINSGDYEGMLKLMADINTGILKTENITTLQVIVGHRLIDGVLCHFIDIGKELGIDVVVQMQRIERTSVNLTELAVTLSNALENAVNACKKAPEGQQAYIKIIGRQHEEQYLIEIANTCFEKVDFNPSTGFPLRSFEGREAFMPEEGFGTQSIAYFAETNNAHLEFEYIDGWFRLRLLI